MEMHDLTTKMMAKIPKIARNCESWANYGCIFPLWHTCLVEALRRVGLAETEWAEYQVETIRLRYDC